jgi:pyocin large subunit-like protein
MDGVAIKPLTVSFSEPGFIAKLNQENQFGPWFTLSDTEQQQLGSPMGPQNPQALNRYSYVLNNPVRNVDPSGHAPPSPCMAHQDCFWNKAYRAIQSAAKEYAGKVIEFGASILGVNPSPVSFASNRELTRHFKDHGSEFGYQNEQEYISGARSLLDDALSGSKQSDIFMVRRTTDGATIIYRRSTNEFMSLGPGDKFIKTYFKPVEGFQYWLDQIK